MDVSLRKRLLQTGIALAIIILAGACGYYLIADGKIDFFTCLYMTVVIITTIGYGQIISLENYFWARPFTIIIAFAGIGVLTYFVSSVSAVIIEGNLRETFKKKKMEKNISKLKDHYIVCGVGQHSRHLIEELTTTERESVFIELDPEVTKDVMRKFPMQKYVEGDATHDEVLIKAGVDRAKGLFASTTNDNLNLVICLSARRLNPKLKIVSLCTNHSNLEKIKIAGADTVVSPNYIGGLRMASEMVRPTVTTLLDIMLRGRDKNLRFEQVNVTTDQEGKTIGQLKLAEYHDTLLIAINSNNELIFKPTDDFAVKKGDVIVLLTTPHERIKLEEVLGT